ARGEPGAKGYRSFLRAECSRAGARTSDVRSNAPSQSGPRGEPGARWLSVVPASRMLALRRADIRCPQQCTKPIWPKGRAWRQVVIGRSCEQNARAPGADI